MKGDVYLSQGKNKSLRPSWEFAEKQRTCWTDWIMMILHGSYSHSLFFFLHVCDSVKFPMTKNLWSLPQAYPSINHWWSIIYATLTSLGRVGPILLNMRTWYTIAASWHTFTNIYSISHITTKYAHEAQPREHSSRTFVHVWNDLVRFLAVKTI